MTWYNYNYSNINLEKLGNQIQFESLIVTPFLGGFTDDEHPNNKVNLEFDGSLVTDEENQLISFLENHNSDTSEFLPNYRVKYPDSTGILTEERWFEEFNGTEFTNLSKKLVYEYQDRILKKLKLTYYYSDGKIKGYQEDLAQLTTTANGVFHSVYNEVKL